MLFINFCTTKKNLSNPQTI